MSKDKNIFNKAKPIRKEPCPICRRHGRDRSGDNLVVYENGGKYCFVCEKTISLSDEYREKLREKEEEEKEIVFPVTDFKKEDWSALKANLVTDPKGFRGLKKSTCDVYRVYHDYHQETGEVATQYYPISKQNEFSGIKIRKNPKAFRAEGTNDSACDLFGQAVFAKSTSKMILVASGELDALSAFQMLETNRKPDFPCIPVVSGTIGEVGSINQYKTNYEFLDRFEKIIFIPDQDEAGEKAIEKVAKSLPRDKLYIVDLPAKDANKMLEDGRIKEFISAFWKHRHYSPAGISGSDVIYDQILEKALVAKIPFPPFLNKLNDVTGGGMVKGSIINISAGSGSGKTTLVNEIVLDMIQNRTAKVGVVSLEADAGDYGENLLGAFIQKKLQLIQSPEEKFEYIASEPVKKAADELFKLEDGKPSFHIIDERGDYDKLQDKIEELIITCDAEVIVVDVLSDVFDGATLEFQAKWMSWEKAICKRYGVIFINIIHARKASGGQKSASTGAVLTEEDMIGSGTQYKSASLNVILSRDKTAEDENIRNMIQVHITKNRQTGWTGCACYLLYNMERHKLEDASNVFEAKKEEILKNGLDNKPFNQKDIPLNKF